MISKSPNSKSPNGSDAAADAARVDAICSRCHIRIEPEDNFGYGRGFRAFVEEFPGVIASGSTPQEARQDAEDGVRLCVNVLLEDGHEPPESLEPRER